MGGPIDLFVAGLGISSATDVFEIWAIGVEVAVVTMENMGVDHNLYRIQIKKPADPDFISSQTPS